MRHSPAGYGRCRHSGSRLVQTRVVRAADGRVSFLLALLSVPVRVLSPERGVHTSGEHEQPRRFDDLDPAGSRGPQRDRRGRVRPMDLLQQLADRIAIQDLIVREPPVSGVIDAVSS